MSLIYVKETDIPKTRTRKDFVRKFVSGIGFTSYNDPECTEIQCETGKFRSISELHQLTMARFPKTSLEAMIRIIKELIDEDAKVTMVWCTQVNKVVLKYLDAASRTYITKYSRDNYLYTRGVDGYSLDDYDKIRKNLKKE